MAQHRTCSRNGSRHQASGLHSGRSRRITIRGTQPKQLASRGLLVLDRQDRIVAVEGARERQGARRGWRLGRGGKILGDAGLVQVLLGLCAGRAKELVKGHLAGDKRSGVFSRSGFDSSLTPATPPRIVQGPRLLARHFGRVSHILAQRLALWLTTSAVSNRATVSKRVLP